MQEARNDIRNHAGAKGATHVALQTNNSDSKIGMWASRVEVTLGGVAYRCGPNGPVITPAPTLTSAQN